MKRESIRRGWFFVLAGLLTLSGCGKFFTSDNPVTPPTNTTAGDVFYIANLGASKLAGYSVASTGALTAISGSPFLPGQPPTSLAITPSNTFLYVGAASGILGYSIGTNGALTQLNGGAALVTDANAPGAMQVDTTGNYLMAASIALSSGSNTPQVGVYAINTSTGALTEQTNSPLAVGNGNGSSTAGPVQLYIAPNDQYVYLTLGSGGTELLSFTSSNGGLGDTLQFIPLATTGTLHNQVVANSTSTLLFLTETGTGVRVFSIASGGALTEISGSPFAAGTGPGGIALDSTGDYLYVANKGANSSNISGYSVGQSGALTALASSPFAAGSLPLLLQFDQSKKFLAVLNQGGSPDVGMYALDATTAGKLDPLTGASFATGVSSIASTQ